MSQPPDGVVAIDPSAAPPRAKPSHYPPALAAQVHGRIKRPLGDLFGLQSFGVNHVTLAPGAIASASASRAASRSSRVGKLRYSVALPTPARRAMPSSDAITPSCKNGTTRVSSVWRSTLEGQQTQVVGLLVGMIDTPMTARWDFPKVSAGSVVTQAYDGVAAGLIEILADETTQGIKLQLSTKAEEFYPWIHEQLRAFVP